MQDEPTKTTEILTADGLFGEICGRGIIKAIVIITDNSNLARAEIKLGHSGGKTIAVRAVGGTSGGAQFDVNKPFDGPLYLNITGTGAECCLEYVERLELDD